MDLSCVVVVACVIGRALCAAARTTTSIRSRGITARSTPSKTISEHPSGPGRLADHPADAPSSYPESAVRL